MDNLEALTAPPICCENKMLLEKDFVDIGVGIQTFPIGYYCELCGNSYPVCSGCSIPIDGREHWSWCDTKKPTADGKEQVG